MDPSQASINANQPEQTKTIICMDLKYYNAAIEGKIEVFKNIIHHQSLDLLLTPSKNTILHIYITALNSGSKSTTNFVEEILKMCPSLLWEANAESESTTNFVEEIIKMCPSLLWKANAKDETPLHIAARYGHGDIVEVLIKYCVQTLHQDVEDGIEPEKKMLRMMNKQRDTALHEAVRYNYPKVVEFLIEKDPNFSYSDNNAYETPLYIAAERGIESVVFNILDKCKSPIMHGGPLGRTALHAAILRGDRYAGKMTQTILDKIEGISRKVDNNGWTPLHLAAYFNHSNLAGQLLNKDREVAYMKDTEGRTALHIAAQRRSVSAMKNIVSMCPDCCELVDNRGWNVLHFIMKGGNKRWWRHDAFEIIIENPSLKNLLNEKNENGDTPFHFYSSSFVSAKNFFRHPRVDKMAFNKKNLSAYDIASTSNTKLPAAKRLQLMKAIYPRPRRVITFKDKDKKDKAEDKKDKDEDQKEEDERSLMVQKAAEAHLVVAALITTVTFAACITMPGGFASGGEGSHPGSALLKRNAAFKAFIILDTISMVLSSCAVFIHLWMPILFNKYYDEEKRENVLFMAFNFILGALVAMALAFVTGTYAVLVPSLDIAIPNLIIGLTFFASLPFAFLKISLFSFLEILRDSIKRWIKKIKRRLKE